MMNLATKKAIVALGWVAVAGTAAPAHAQGIPVHDSSSLLQQIEQVRQAVQMIEQGRQQIEEAQRLYDDVSGLTDIPRVAEDFANDAMRGLNVGEGSLQDFGTGDYDFVGTARQRVDRAYQDMLESLGGQADDAAQATARRIAGQVGMAETVGSSVQARREQIIELSNRLATAESSKEVADLQARIQAESLGLQNDMLALQAIQLEQQAADAVRAQNAVNARRAGLRSQREAFDDALGD